MFEHIVFLRNKLFETYGVEFHIYDGIYSKPHNHEGYWELFVIIDGKAAHCFRNETKTVDMNDIQLMRPRDRHHFRSLGAYCRHISISLDNNIVKGMLDGIDVELYQKMIEYEGDIGVRITDAMREELTAKIQRFKLLPEAKNHSVSVELKFIFLTLLQRIYATLFAETVNYPILIRDAIHYMQTHYTESLSLEEICAFLGCTHISLLRQFKQHTGKTPVRYLLDLKLEKAFSLLVSTEYKVIEICNMVGIYSVSYFNKKFKEKFGFTPTNLKHKEKKQFSS